MPEITNEVAFEFLLIVIEKEFRYSRNEILEKVSDPDWSDDGRVHNWKNHVDESMKCVWKELSPDARLIAFIYAKTASDNEYWE